MFTIVEYFGGSYGAAGGQKFHSWMQDTTEYDRIHTISLENSGQDIRLEIFQRNDSPLVELNLPTKTMSKQANEENCRIQ